MFYRVFSNGANVIINDINLAVSASNKLGVLVKQEQFENSQQAQYLLLAGLIRIEPVQSLASAAVDQIKSIEVKAPVPTSSAFILDQDDRTEQKDETPVFVRNVLNDDSVKNDVVVVNPTTSVEETQVKADTSTEVEFVIESPEVEVVETVSDKVTEVQAKKEVKQNKNKKGK